MTHALNWTEMNRSKNSKLLFKTQPDPTWLRKQEEYSATKTISKIINVSMKPKTELPTTKISGNNTPPHTHVLFPEGELLWSSQSFILRPFSLFNHCYDCQKIPIKGALNNYSESLFFNSAWPHTIPQWQIPLISLVPPSVIYSFFS